MVADGVTRLTGESVQDATVRVSLTPCGSARGMVVDHFLLQADNHGRLDAVYAGTNLCVLRLDPLSR